MHVYKHFCAHMLSHDFTYICLYWDYVSHNCTSVDFNVIKLNFQKITIFLNDENHIHLNKNQPKMLFIYFMLFCLLSLICP